MAERTLNIGPGVSLPVEAVTETFAMLAKRGMGKSNAAVVMAEEMSAAGEQWIAIDPKGDWWGIRSNADGSGPGLPAPVFGGRHGDLPLDAGAGTMLAHLIVDRSLTAVIDVSLFSKAEQIRFVTDFAEALFRAAADDPAPRHLFLEEAEEFLPQRVDARAARMVGAYSKIAKQGRTSGLGVTLITQRSASLNKDALSQTDTLILFRTVSPHDRKAVVAWAEHHAESMEIASTLAELAPGESWILSPGFLGRIERVKWRRRTTFDSGATPAMGGKRKAPPVSLADIDLAEIKEQMAETVERAKADDPKLLRKEIARLERALADRPAPEVQQVEVVCQVAPPWLGEELRALQEQAGVLAARVEQVSGPLEVTVLPTVEQAARTAAAARARVTQDRPPARRVAPSRDDEDVSLGKAERKILTVLVQFPEGRTKTQVAVLSGYSVKSSGLSNALGRLRSLGYATKGSTVTQATPEGVAALGEIEPLPTGQALVDHWMGQLGKAERMVLAAMMDAYPAEMSKQEVADAAGYSSTSSGLSNALGKLRSLDLVHGWVVSDVLMDAVR